MPSDADYLPICRQATQAGVQVIRAAGDDFKVTTKAPADFVTDVDLASQRAIVDVIRSACPDHGILGEEDGETWSGSDAPCWLIDPLDGTTNFVHGLPHYAVSVAFVREGRPVVGCIADPCRDELFWAVRHAGAGVDDRPLQTSGQSELGQALVAVSLPASVSADAAEIQQMVRTIDACRAVRRLGSAALNLAYVAAGRLDAYWATSLSAWDVAAGVLLIEEAGGIVTSLDGGAVQLRHPSLCAASSVALHQELRTVIRA